VSSSQLSIPECGNWEGVDVFAEGVRVRAGVEDNACCELVAKLFTEPDEMFCIRAVWFGASLNLYTNNHSIGCFKIMSISRRPSSRRRWTPVAGQPFVRASDRAEPVRTGLQEWQLDYTRLAIRAVSMSRAGSLCPPLGIITSA
jgi:hypothetical protein